MQKLIIEFSDERLITPSGLSLVGQMLGKSNFIKKCNNMKVDSKRSQSQIKNGDILLSYIGLLCQGKTAYEDIREMSADPDYYKLALGITRTIPSAETLDKTPHLQQYRMLLPRHRASRGQLLQWNN